MSISVINVTKNYGTQKALDNVSFNISTGQIVGFLGPNGAGKTTMMKIITGFIPPTFGSITVCGFDVQENALEVKSKIGYLPENNPLYLDMYVKEYLLFVAGLYKISERTSSIVDAMIEKTGLTAEHKKKIGALSKGYRQRVGLAQALIHNPEVLILDEPTSGLDPNQIIEIRNLILSLGKEKTIMLSTHIMQEVEALCNRVIIINQGRIVADDKVTNIQQHISEDYIYITVEFDANPNENELLKIKGVVKVTHKKNTEWFIQSKSNVDVRPVLFEFAVKNNRKVLSLIKHDKTIEQVFHELTK